MKNELYRGMLKDGKPHPCGYNLWHTIRLIKNEDGHTIYEVSFYIPGYGIDKIRCYKTLAAAKAGITKYDKEY